MRHRIMSFALAVSAVASTTTSGRAASFDFQEYKRAHGKRYVDAKAESLAEQCWRQNVLRIEALQRENGLGTVTFGENEYTDQCTNTFLASRTMSDVPDGTCWKSPIPAYDKKFDTSKAIDWRAKGAVTAV